MNNQTPIEVSAEEMKIDSNWSAEACTKSLVQRVVSRFPGLPLRIDVDLVDQDSTHTDMSPAAPEPKVRLKAIFDPLSDAFALESSRFEGFMSRMGCDIIIGESGVESILANPIGMAWFVGWYNRAELQAETDAAREPVIHEGMHDAPNDRHFLAWDSELLIWKRVIKGHADPIRKDPNRWNLTHWQECLPPPVTKVLWETEGETFPPHAEVSGSAERFVPNPGEYGTRSE